MVVQKYPHFRDPRAISASPPSLFPTRGHQAFPLRSQGTGAVRGPVVLCGTLWVCCLQTLCLAKLRPRSPACHPSTQRLWRVAQAATGAVLKTLLHAKHSRRLFIYYLFTKPVAHYLWRADAWQLLPSLPASSAQAAAGGLTWGGR